MNYLEQLVENIKINVSKLENNSDKEIINKIIPKTVNNRKRALCSEYNIMSKHYRLKSKGTHESTEGLLSRAVQLRNEKVKIVRTFICATQILL